MWLKSWTRKNRQRGPAHFNISLEIWSRPVAFPFVSFLVWERISVGVISSSRGRLQVWVDGGLVLK